MVGAAPLTGRAAGTRPVPRVIDLGEAGAPAGPGVPRRWSPPGRTGRWLLALTAVLSLLPGGAAPGRPAQLVALLRVPAGPLGGYALGGGRLVVDAGGTVRAYRVADHTPLWSVPAPGPVARFTLVGAAGVVLCGWGTPAGDGGTVSAYDLATGAPLWAGPGGRYQPVGDSGTALRPEPGPAGGTRVVSVDLRTGAQRWLIAADARTTIHLAGAYPAGTVPARLAVYTAPGRLTVYDAVSGRPVATGQIGLSDVDTTVGTARPDIVLGVYLAGTELMVVAGTAVRPPAGGFGYVLRGYDADTLVPRWLVPVAVAGGVVADCAPVLCWSVGATVTGIDPARGPLWTRPGGVAQPLAAGRILVTDLPGEDGRVLDAGTGATLLRLGRTSVLVGRWSTAALVSRTEPGPATAWFWLLDLAVPALRPLARLAGVDGSRCALDADTFACLDTAGQVTVWRLRLR